MVLAILILAIANGCQRAQPGDAAETTEAIDALKGRLDKLERVQRPDANRSDPATVQVDTSKAHTHYADVTHVLKAGRNVLVYFGNRNYASGESSRSTTPFGAYMNYYTAKRLQAALSLSIQRHAALFGDSVPDTDSVQPALPDATLYVNFVRLTGSPEELVIDLGLNPKPVGASADSIPISNVIIMDYHTTSRFFRQMSELVSEYESKHGTLETDIQKRIAN